MKGLASAFFSLFKSETYNKRKGIYENGDGHSYPFLIDDYIDNSVTATRCSQTMATYLVGKGFGETENEIIVNKQKGTTLLQFAQDIAASKARHNGVFIHVNINANYELESLDVLPFAHCAVGKKDDDDYNGKIVVCKDWRSETEVKKAVAFDVYNEDPSVIDAQVEAAGGWAKYKGQILYFKYGKSIYPLAPIHPVRHDAESEPNASIFKNRALIKGYHGKMAVITKPLVDPLLERNTPEWIEQDNAREKFRTTMQEFNGAINNDGFIHIEMEFDSDDIDKEIIFKTIDTNLNDALFKHTEETASENICVAYGINPNLIRPTGTALFSQSGEAFKQMKLDYQEETSDERLILQQITNKLMRRFTEPMKDLKIIPRIQITENDAIIDNQGDDIEVPRNF